MDFFVLGHKDNGQVLYILLLEHLDHLLPGFFLPELIDGNNV
jgi:hypothetical protein